MGSSLTCGTAGSGLVTSDVVLSIQEQAELVDLTCHLTNATIPAQVYGYLLLSFLLGGRQWE